MRFWLRSLTCLGLLLLVFSWSTYATTVMYRSPQQLGAESDLVIRGRVESSESYWNDKHTKVFTRTRIAVDEAYKGGAPATVDVVQLGGKVGNVKVTVHGASRWKVGEEVLVFAEPHDETHFRVAGFSQGKFMIERDPDTGEAFIRAPRMEGIQLLGAPGDGKAEALAREGVPLGEFVSHALGSPTTPGVPR
jgi:hypothetical protein